MQPRELRPENFSHYPPQGRAFAVKHLVVLQHVPLVLLPILLLQVIEYDWLFPVEHAPWLARSTISRCCQALPSHL